MGAFEVGLQQKAPEEAGGCVLRDEGWKRVAPPQPWERQGTGANSAAHIGRFIVERPATQHPVGFIDRPRHRSGKDITPHLAETHKPAFSRLAAAPSPTPGCCARGDQKACGTGYNVGLPHDLFVAYSEARNQSSEGGVTEVRAQALGRQPTTTTRKPQLLLREYGSLPQRKVAEERR